MCIFCSLLISFIVFCSVYLFMTVSSSSSVECGAMIVRDKEEKNSVVNFGYVIICKIDACGIPSSGVCLTVISLQLQVESY